jgi:hypothetical protein
MTAAIQIVVQARGDAGSPEGAAAAVHRRTDSAASAPLVVIAEGLRSAARAPLSGRPAPTPFEQLERTADTDRPVSAADVSLVSLVSQINAAELIEEWRAEYPGTPIDPSSDGLTQIKRHITTMKLSGMTIVELTQRRRTNLVLLIHQLRDTSNHRSQPVRAAARANKTRQPRLLTTVTESVRVTLPTSGAASNPQAAAAQPRVQGTIVRGSRCPRCVIM